MIAAGVVRRFGELLSEAERRMIEAIREQRVETEPSITDRFLNEIEHVFDEHGGRQGIVFRARTLRDRGRNAAETKFGADFCGVLDIRLEDFEQTKGILSQAKMEGYGINVRKGPYGLTTVDFRQNDEFKRLNEQIRRMLSITPDSFVIIYSRNGFVVVPASSVEGLKTGAELYGKPVDSFFKEYLMCFVGDPRLKAFDDGSLERLRRETSARTAIIFQVYQVGDKPW